MPSHNLHTSISKSASGFTIIEVLVVISLSAIIGLATFSFFNDSFRNYLALQEDGTAFSDLSLQSQKLASVLRGVTDFVTVNSNDITVYAYFSPQDAYVSQVHYYHNIDNTKLMADITPMTANPPNGTLITAKKRTYTVVGRLYTPPSSSIFTYLDSSGNPLTLPISDLLTIKGIKVSLSVPSKGTGVAGYSTMSLQVSLRNRKTNL
ncbi:MAG: hypothetical protein JWS12_122 [Candidatus Saccharibacteria bacterium]|nr:hypothetical protein [Candidatus Saccharibacteria bacterium]